MPPQDGLRLDYLSSTEEVRPEPGHPYEQRPVTAAQSKTRRCPPQSDAELMTEKQIFSFKRHRELNMPATNIPSACRIANIDANDAMIVSHGANLQPMTFSERTTLIIFRGTRA
jgi:hypothetical protein